MRSKSRVAAVFCLFAVVACRAEMAHAHHTAGHAAPVASINPISATSAGGVAAFFDPFGTEYRLPRTHVSLNTSFDWLDDSRGRFFVYQLAGEYAFGDWLSLGAQLPFATVSGGVFQTDTSIGDVSFIPKGTVWQNRETAVQVGLQTSFPTGNESKGLGAGEVLFSPFSTLSHDFGIVYSFLNLGTTVAASDRASPAMNYAVGAGWPVLGRSSWFDLYLALQGTWLIKTPTFLDGSAKAYLAPGVIFKPGGNWLLSLGGKFSVIDTLQVKNGVTLTASSPALLSDSIAGFTFNIDYLF